MFWKKPIPEPVNRIHIPKIAAPIVTTMAMLADAPTVSEDLAWRLWDVLQAPTKKEKE